ncbi:hypothetical protein BDN71DRAFT_1593083 [Pleurotus eryngii]|uniref:Uncharacterized protein n=1 Tax=Pleurotus eryngii TaxID=5323 RepID=A0A9P5ZM84_PLEER|nr:hypothetical protein BDN71DRAFT_1593083 [Pleurotus eryngii]
MTFTPCSSTIFTLLWRIADPHPKCTRGTVHFEDARSCSHTQATAPGLRANLVRSRNTTSFGLSPSHTIYSHRLTTSSPNSIFTDLANTRRLTPYHLSIVSPATQESLARLNSPSIPHTSCQKSLGQQEGRCAAIGERALTLPMPPLSSAISTPVHKQVMIPGVSAWDGCCIQLKPFRLSQRPEGLCTPLHIEFPRRHPTTRTARARDLGQESSLQSLPLFSALATNSTGEGLIDGTTKLENCKGDEALSSSMVTIGPVGIPRLSCFPFAMMLYAWSGQPRCMSLNLSSWRVLSGAVSISHATEFCALSGTSSRHACMDGEEGNPRIASPFAPSIDATFGTPHERTPRAPAFRWAGWRDRAEA